MTKNKCYPLKHFPTDLRRMINIIQDVTHADEAIIATTVLGVMSSAIQGNMDILLPSGKISPSSLWVCSIAESGAGKTAVFNMLNAGVEKFECEKKKIIEIERVQNEPRLKVWKLIEKELDKKLKNSIIDGDDYEDILKRIRAHSLTKPKTNPWPRVLYSDTTIQALVHGMCVYWPNTSYTSDEGSLFFNGLLSNAFSVINRCWDGSPVTVDRKSNKDQIFVENPRLTILLGIQNKQFDKFVKSKGDGVRDIGGLARMLFCRSDPPDFTLSKKDKALLFNRLGVVKAFTDYTFDQLEKSVCSETGAPVKKQSIFFDEQAAACYDDFIEELESKVKTWWGPLFDYKDYVRKSYQHVARVAGLFAYYYGHDRIDRNTILDAIQIVAWYINEFRLIFTDIQNGAEFETYARILDEWFDSLVSKSNRRFFLKNEIRRYAPNKLRDKKKLDGAMSYLFNHGRIGFFEEDSIVDIFPQRIFDSKEYYETILSYKRKELNFYRS